LSSQQPSVSVLPNLCQDKAVFFLVLVAQVFVVLLLLADQSSSSFDWQRLAIITIHVQWVCLVSAALICWSQPLFVRFKPWKKLLAAYVICVTNGFLVSLVGQILLNAQGIDWNTVLRHTALTMLIAALVLRYFYLQYQLVRQSESELEARLQALHSRIRPHFLFNSLNSVASLIPVDPESAEKAVEDLADIFRASLNHSSDLVSLEKEIELCKRYLFIESLRLGDRLRQNWAIHADTTSWKIPHLTLQPLIENAIVHGIQNLAAGGEINISIHDSPSSLKITLTNPLPDEVQGTHGNQIGVDNIRHRLQVLFGREASVKNYIQGDQYICILSIPRESGN